MARAGALGRLTAGALVERIRIETPSVEIDELGAETETFIHDADVWSNPVQTPGREFLSGGYVAEEKVIFGIRWREVNSKARVIWRDRTYRIDGITGTASSGDAWLYCTVTDGAN